MARRSLSILLLLLLAGSAGLFHLASRPEAAMAVASGPEAAVRLTVAPVQPERVLLETEASGRVAAGRRVEIRPQVGGLILERPVQEGARVAAGAVLLRIDPAPLQADLGMAEAALARAEAAAAHARRAADRAEALLARSAISREKNDTAHNDWLLASAGVAEARAVVDRKRLDLGFATLRSPIAGHLTAGLADVGALATPGAEKPLAVVQDLETVSIDLRLPVRDLAPLLQAARDGLGPVQILPDRAGATPVTGAISSSDRIVDPATGSVTLRLATANPDLALLPGMFVRARLPRGVLPRALLVPEEAVLRTGGGGAQLVVVSPAGTAMRRDVVLGERVGPRILVLSGLTPGERVAIRGQDRVPEGGAIPVIPLAAEASAPDPQL